MLDFTVLANGTGSLQDLARGLTKADLHQLTDEMIDMQLAVLASATDKDVVFVPVDRTTDGGTEEGWPLSHVVTHTTATAEDTAVAASSLARGIVASERSLYEVPWETVKTVAQVRQRLEESRRMRHAFLETWPDEPHLETTRELPFGNFGPMNAVAFLVLGLVHDNMHLEQMREILRQAHAAQHSA